MSDVGMASGGNGSPQGDSAQAAAPPAPSASQAPSVSEATVSNLLAELAKAQNREAELRADFEHRLFEARAAIQHFAAQSAAATHPVAQAVPQQSVSPTASFPQHTARPAVLPQLVAPALPTVPVGQLLTAGQGRACVYGPTVQARHDVAVYHALGYDAGDLIRASTEATARQREQERQALIRPMVPLSEQVHFTLSGSPRTNGPVQSDVYQEDNLVHPTQRSPTQQVPNGVHLSVDGSTYVTPFDRPGNAPYQPTQYHQGPTAGPQSGNKGQSDYRGKNKMLPPHLHLKGWDVSADRFREWYRSIELFFVDNDVPRERWGPAIVAACFDRAHQALRNLDVMRLTESGAVDAITFILASTFLRPHEDKIEEYEKRYCDFRRPYGMPMHDYIQEFEVIEAAYLAEDAGTVLSEQSRAKRLLDTHA